jgi:AcrR family transcriptional regulator
MARPACNPNRDIPEVRREQILEEAIRILGRLGYHGFTIHELAERCGLSNAGLLYHFPSKSQLFVAVVQELEQREIQALAPLIAALERDERRGVPLTAIVDLLHAMVSRGGTRPELVRFYAVLQSESLDQGHPAHDSFRTRESAVLELFTRLVLPYVAEPRSTARQLLALLDGLRLQWLRAHQNFDVVTEWVHAVVLLVPALAPLAEKHGLASGVKAKRKALPAQQVRKRQVRKRARRAGTKAIIERRLQTKIGEIANVAQAKAP